MTLEDFILLTKMTDGLTVPSRVEELISIIQKEKDNVVKNMRDATKQWAAVASALAATENRDCLDRFIQLDGLGFIDRWLKQVHNFGNDTNESFIEESITALLGALEKLHIDYERSSSSGIWITVKSLLDHSSSQIQDRARTLFDSWNQGRGSEVLDHDDKCGGSSHDDDIAANLMSANESSTVPAALDVPLPVPCVSEEDSRAESAETKIPPVNSECVQPEKVEDVQTKTDDIELYSCVKFDDTDMDIKPPDHLSAPEDKFPVGTIERISPVEAFSFPASKHCCKEELSDALKMNELSKEETCVPKVSSFPRNICETSVSTTLAEPRAVSSAVDVASALDTVSGPAEDKIFDTNDHDRELGANATAVGDVSKLASEPKIGMDDMEDVLNCSTPAFKSTSEDDDFHSDAMQDSSGNELTYEKPKDLETSFSVMKGVGATDKDKDHLGGGFDSRNDAASRRASDVELDYGIVDALEVARKVAREVEREIMGYREPSCSSSAKSLGGRIGPPESPDSVNEKHLIEAPENEVPTERQSSSEAYSEDNDKLFSSDNGVAEAEDGTADMDSSQVTEAAQEPKGNREKGLCAFDLNQEVFSDDMEMDHVNHVPTSVSVVSASRPAAAPGLPAAPLQFEGTLGWKGTAATSAFRPASPRRFSDFEKTTITVGCASNSLKQRHDFLDIDLNVAESGIERPAGPLTEKQIPFSSGLHSAESSVEASPRRSERLNLDLNRISNDNDAPPSDLRMEKQFLYNHNGHCSPSPASSSSSMQPLLRNFDLNDRPFLHNDSLDQWPYHGKSSRVGAFLLPKADDPVISIMGAGVQVSRTQYSPMPNGKSVETAVDGNMARSGVLGLGPTVSFTNSPLFGYNGFATSSSLSYSSPIYGPGSTIPYMVDSRGAPVVPQIVGSVAALPVPPSYSQPPPFIMNMTGAPSISGATRPNFDLNSGFPSEGGNRDSLGLRQLFMPGQGRSMEEHFMTSSQPSSSSGVGGKRKEPDGGNYRHQQPPWN